MKFTSIGLVIVSLILAACSDRVESGANAGIFNPVEESGNGPASAFDYKRFYYGTSGVCGGNSFYFKLLKAEDMLLGQRDGQDILVESAILLYENHHFEVEYIEKYITEYTANGYKYKRMKSRFVSGEWREESGRLILGNLMEISGKEVEKRAVATVMYKQDIITRGLQNKATRGAMVWSSSAIKSERETCPSEQDTLGNFARFKTRENRSEIHLKSLANSDGMVVGNILIKKLELLIEEDGHYYVVAHAALPNVAYVRPYIVDSGIWQRSGSSLKLYNGFVNTTFAGNQADLKFTRNVMLFTDTNAYSLAVEGKSVRMVLGYSDLSADALTDTYR